MRTTARAGPFAGGFGATGSFRFATPTGRAARNFSSAANGESGGLGFVIVPYIVVGKRQVEFGETYLAPLASEHTMTSQW
jgi:hypothetical protein